MKLLNRLKYRLWRWLMNDLCTHSGTTSECDGCECSYPYEENGIIYPCAQNRVYCQAYRVWMIEEMMNTDTRYDCLCEKEES